METYHGWAILYDEKLNQHRAMRFGVNVRAKSLDLLKEIIDRKNQESADFVKHGLSIGE